MNFFIKCMGFDKTNGVVLICVGFAVEFGTLALELVVSAQKFVIVTLAAINQLLITRWTVFAIENTT